MVSIAPAVHVDAPWLDSGGVTLLGIVEVEGTTYFKFTKSDHRVIRLMTGKSRVNVNPLTSSAFVDRLTEARNKALASLSKELQPEVVEEDLGLDKADPIDVSHLLPKYITIDTPEVDGVSLRVKVLCNMPHKSLWIELSPEVLDHMRKAIAAATNDEAEVDAKRSRAARGPYFDKDRNAYRVRHTRGDVLKIKDFRVTDDAEDAKAITYRAALDFCEANRIELEPAIPIASGSIL